MRSPPANRITPGQHLDQKLEVWTHRMQIVVQDPAEKSESRAARMVSTALNENPRLRRGTHQADQSGNSNAEQERQKNSYTTQTRKRPLVQVPLQARPSDPATSHREIAYVPGQDKRSQHRGRKDSQVEKRQPIPLGPVVCNSETLSCQPGSRSVPQNRRARPGTIRRRKQTAYVFWLLI